MTNINDLGLPQGLAEIANSYNAYNAQQDYANRSLGALSNYYVRPREMTATDLGLWCDCLDVDCETCNPLGAPDAPYSFWLGADK